MNKKLVLLIILISAVIMGCEKQDKEPEKPQPPATEQEPQKENPPLNEEYPVAADCAYVPSFWGSVSFLSDNIDVYLIKGVVLDKIEYGLSIRLIEDLKGNFTENADVFTVWGAGMPFTSLERGDDLKLYNKGDTLIMHIENTPYMSSLLDEDDMRLWLEKPEDYSTIPCTFSVVKLSDSYVTGSVFSGIDKLSLDEFQQKLNEALKK